jgi:hypothetical protein
MGKHHSTSRRKLEREARKAEKRIGKQRARQRQRQPAAPAPAQED